MRIYLGLENNTEIVELKKETIPEILLIQGNFKDFISLASPQAVYLPFSLLEKWNIVPKVHQSQVVEIPKDMKEQFGNASFVITGASLKDSDPKTVDYETEVFCQCLVKAMIKHNIESLAIWTGLFSYHLQPDLCLKKLIAAVKNI